jgi:ATP-binding cassette subfamily C protein
VELRLPVNFRRRGAERFRAKTPTTLQLEAVECGAAALSMVLAYYGRIVPLAILRQDCGVSRDGSKASNVLKAARRYGMVAKGFSKTVESLTTFEQPLIVFWNFNHFVVVEGFGDGVVFINDPAVGHRAIDDSEFETSFTGVVLVMEPGPEFERGGRRPSVVAALRDRLVGSHEALGYCVLAGFLLIIPGLVLPAFSQIFLDEVFVAQRTDWLRPMLVAMGWAVVLQGVLKFMQLRQLRRMMIALSVRMSGRFMWHLLNLPAMFYAQRSPGEVADRSRLNDKLAEVVSGQLAEAVIGVVMMIFYAGLMFYYDAVLTVIGIVFAATNILVLRWVSGQRVEANMRVLQEYGKVQGLAVAGLQSIETIKSSGQEDSFFSRWSGYYAKATNARQQLQLSNQSLSVLPAFLNSLSGVVLIIVGGVRVIDGNLTIGMLVAIQSLMMSFRAPLNMLMGLGGTLQEIDGDLNRVNDVLHYPVEPDVADRELVDDHQEPVVRLKGYVEVRNVTFGYSSLEPPLLDDFSVSIRPGQRVALVGGSGSGKTTITKLISGEYTPWKGEVCFDDITRQEVPRPVLVNSFATVTQEIFLFEGTIRDNLTMWDPTVPKDSLVRAAEDAAIHETILALPGGYDSVLLEGGGNLSGGQRQRLEIARALVNSPSVLVLDEATSALDSETESVVMERLRMRGCAAIIVAHRLSTIRDCDEIIVLEKGRVVERGTHDELWAKEGQYAALIRTANS